MSKRRKRHTRKRAAGHEGESGTIPVTPNEHSHDYQATNDVASKMVVNVPLNHINIEDDINDDDADAPLVPVDFDSLDPYTVLGVSPNATTQQIKTSFQNLAKQHHLDCLNLQSNKEDAHSIFAAILNAYETLVDMDHMREHGAALRPIDTHDMNKDGNSDEASVSEEDSRSEGEKDCDKEISFPVGMVQVWMAHNDTPLKYTCNKSD
jgi:hypothetical protein